MSSGLRFGLNVGGGDSPENMISGAQGVLEQRRGFSIVLYGTEEQVNPHINDFEVVVTGPVLRNGEDVETLFRQHKDEPVRVACRDIRNGKLDGLLDCGNTAVTVSASAIDLGRVSTKTKPALPFDVPRIVRKGEDQVPDLEFTMLLDVGATKDRDPELLSQFAKMGAVLLGDTPTIKVLGMGGEDSKGTKEQIEALELIRTDFPNLDVAMGEGYSVFDGSTRLLVCDGPTGNAIIKSSKELLNGILGQVLMMLNRTPEAQVAKEVVRADMEIFKRLDPQTLGAALVLGVKGLVFKGNGNSGPAAVLAGFDQLQQAHEDGVIPRMTEAFRKAA